MLGDPHFATIDGLGYTFNGVGEYVLLKSPTFQLQCRTVRALDENGTSANASVFGAFSAKDDWGKHPSGRIHVSLDDDRESEF